jgi:hypothetical protein
MYRPGECVTVQCASCGNVMQRHRNHAKRKLFCFTCKRARQAQIDRNIRLQRRPEMLTISQPE